MYQSIKGGHWGVYRFRFASLSTFRYKATPHRSTTYRLNEIRKRFFFLLASARLVYKGWAQFAFFFPLLLSALAGREPPKKNSRLALLQLVLGMAAIGLETGLDSTTGWPDLLTEIYSLPYIASLPYG
jgi:hypothetical protein